MTLNTNPNVNIDTAPHVPDPIELRAERRESTWVAAAPARGIYVQAKTLDNLHNAAADAVALRFDASAPPVVIVPDGPQLNALRQARNAYERALRDAVRHLRSSRTTWRDVAAACEVTQPRARNALDALPISPEQT